ncbi:MAG: hypothetical protein U0360_07655 [Dehalococcoidia bacterium]
MHENVWEGDDDSGTAVDDVEASTDLVDDEAFEPPVDELDEIAAVSAAEASELLETQAALEVERARNRALLARYRDAILEAEPELPPELVHGASLEELDASMAAARSAVAGISARLSETRASSERGFPVGAPARAGASTAGMSASEKIRRGLEARARG